MLCIGSVSNALAKHGMGRGQGLAGKKQSILPRGQWWNNPELAQKVNLSDKQLNQLQQIFRKNMSESIQVKGSIELLHFDLNSAFSEEKFDKAHAQKLLSQLLEKQMSQKKMRMHTLIDMRALLSKDQYMTLKQHMSQRKKMGYRQGEKSRR